MPRLVARPWEGKPSERRTNRPIARGPGARADPVCRTARPNGGPVLSLRRRRRVEMRSIPEPGMTRLRPAGRPAPPGGADRRTGLPRPFPAPRDGTAPDGSPFSPPGRSAGPTPARGAPPSSARKNRRRPEGSPASRSPPGAGPDAPVPRSSSQIPLHKILGQRHAPAQDAQRSRVRYRSEFFCRPHTNGWRAQLYLSASVPPARPAAVGNRAGSGPLDRDAIMGNAMKL